MKWIGLDLYNHVLTGNVACTINESSIATATRSGPSVLEIEDDDVQEDVESYVSDSV